MPGAGKAGRRRRGPWANAACRTGRKAGRHLARRGRGHARWQLRRQAPATGNNANNESANR